MSRGLFSFFSIFIVLSLSAIYYSSAIQSPIISTLNSIKLNYHYSIEYVEKTIEKHFFQAKHISDLNEQLQQYENNHLVMQELASEIDDLLKESNSTLKIDPRVELVRAISYESFANLNRVWLDIEDYNSSKIYGLTYRELVAGIVIQKDGRALGVLNYDAKSTYSVFIGSELAPGIAKGNNNGTISINFIPAWYKVSVNDEVRTSGLDKIFFKGLRVGKIISVTKSQGYQNAIVTPYYVPNEPNYFHMIRKIR